MSDSAVLSGAALRDAPVRVGTDGPARPYTSLIPLLRELIDHPSGDPPTDDVLGAFLGSAVPSVTGKIRRHFRGMPTLSISHTLRRLRGLVDRSPVVAPELPAARRGAGPVVLVGGFCTTDLTLAPLRENLGRLGYTVTTYTVGTGMGCGRRSVEGLAEVVRAVAADHDAPVQLLGYSRGGQFARVLATDPTMPVRSLVTLGTPFDVYGISLPLRAQAGALAVAGTLGVPGLFTLSCFLGSCCTRFHDGLRAVPDVPFTAIYSRDDRLVRWRSCIDPAAHTVEVPGSHLGLLVDREPLRAVADALQRESALAVTA